MNHEIQLEEVEGGAIPMDLLLEADPSEKRVRSYLDEAWCFAAIREQVIVGACIAGETGPGTAEIHNIAVRPDCQKQGVGSDLLKFVLTELAVRGMRRAELGTGTFGHQLTYYQRLGFRVDSVVKDHFPAQYPEPIYENDIEHRDQLRLFIEL